MLLSNKKLLIIGGGAYAKHLREYKDAQGFTVISVGDTIDPRANGLVDKHYYVNRKDVKSIAEVVKKEHIDGIFVGSSEEYVSIAIDVCEITDARFYVTREQWDIVANKAKFKEFARKSGFPVIPEYKLSHLPTREEIVGLEYPVMIKPVDSSGARGLNACYSADSFMCYYEEAMRWSPSKNVIVESLITDAIDIFVNYTIQDGECTLSYVFTKEKVRSSNNYVSLPLFHFYPTTFIDDYYRIADEPAKKMIREMGLKNGTLTLQGFIKGGRFYFYEAGFRMGGAQAYVLTDYMNGANVLHYMVNFALTGRMSDKRVSSIENARFRFPCCNYYVELKAGIIDYIEGIEEVKNMPGVLNITQMCHPGDEIMENNQIGRAVFRIHVVGNTPSILAQRLVDISRTLKVVSTVGEEMQIEKLEYNRCLKAILKNWNLREN